MERGGGRGEGGREEGRRGGGEEGGRGGEEGRGKRREGGEERRGRVSHMRKCVDKRDKATSRRGIQEGGFPWLLWWAGRDTQIPGPPLTSHIDHTVPQEHTAHPSDMSTVCVYMWGRRGGWS